MHKKIFCSYKGSESILPGDDDDFKYSIEQFADIEILRYRLPGFEKLKARQKEMIWYLAEAALWGRDIIWDQNFKYNLRIRKTLEAVLNSYSGNRNTAEYNEFLVYAKRVFFANGIHHHYSTDKFEPGFSPDYFLSLIKNSDESLLPLKDGGTEELADTLIPVLFDRKLYPRKIESGAGADIIKDSATNLYDGLSLEEVEKYYAGITDHNDEQPVSHGLNSRLVKRGERIYEEVYHIDGLYGKAIKKIVYWLEKARSVAGNEMQERELGLLIDYYKTGDLKTWDEYNILWAGNYEPVVDYVNGFVEVYGDPVGMKATWESVVNYKDTEATKRAEIISSNARWFEDRSPVNDNFKKEKVKGIRAKVINVAMLGGDCYPAAPIGINLPNSDWIRKVYGSKSVSLANITIARDEASRDNGLPEEFASSARETERAKKYASPGGILHTDLHEILGHGSGKLAPGTDPNALKNYSSTLEEIRADLYALYYIPDKKIFELGLLPDKEASMAVYDSYIRNGLLTQLARIEPGKDIEQAHMRCRATICNRALEKGNEDNTVELFEKNGKTYVRINNYDRLRDIFAGLLREVQRIKSEGDYNAGRDLIETYGIKVNKKLHKEVIERYAKLNIAPYSGNINPLLVPVKDAGGQITDVKVEYPDDYLGQMLEYGKYYACLDWQ